MEVQCARKRHRLETEHEKLAAVVGGANTRVNWGLDNPKFSGRGTDARFFLPNASKKAHRNIVTDTTVLSLYVALASTIHNKT